MTKRSFQKRTLLIPALALALSLAACGGEEMPASSGGGSPSGQEGETAVTLSPEGVDIRGTGAAALTDGTVSITAGGSYRLSGSLEGSVVVDAPGQAVELILDGAEIRNPDGPAILFREAEEALVTLGEAGENFLADGGTGEEYDAALYSVPSLTIAGEGSLTVEGSRQEGVATELHLTVEGGRISVTAADDGFNANCDGVSLITINGGDISISAGGDGIDSNGGLTIAGGRVFAASPTSDMSGGLDCDGELIITGGEVIATGAMNTMPAESSSQPALVWSLSGTREAGTLAEIRLGEETVAAFAPPREYSQVFYSAPGLDEAAEYTLFTGGEGSGEDPDLPGLYESAQGGAEEGSATTASVEENRGPGPFGGGPGGPGGPGGFGPPPDGERPEGEPPDGIVKSEE